VRAAFVASIQTGLPYDIEHRCRRADGVYRWFHVRALPVRDDEGRITCWYVLLIDIDDRKQAEEALRSTEARLSRATRIATVGELSASIAHEINQPLAAAVASAQACVRFLAAQPPNVARAHEAAESIVRDGKDAGEVVRRIRALFKRAAVEKVMLNLNDVIGEVLRLLASDAAKRQVVVEADLMQNLPPVPGDRVQLQQVLLNLFLNGIEAMDTVQDRSKKLIVRATLETPDTVLVAVRDNGIGLENPDRVFEAFVTTKQNGMGIGLTICRSKGKHYGDSGRTCRIAFGDRCHSNRDGGAHPAHDRSERRGERRQLPGAHRPWFLGDHTRHELCQGNRYMGERHRRW
jgi:signal transduction histidine kinase